MKVLVLGGTGPSGTHIIEHLFRESHTVVVYARSPSKLPESITSNPSVTIVKGELTDREALKGALFGVHAVVSALGPATKNGPLHPAGTPLAKAYALLLEVMKEQGVKRIIVLGTASIKDSRDKFNLQFWTLINGVALFARTAYNDVVAIGETIRADPEVIYTIARVPLLNNKEDERSVAGYVGDGVTKTSLSRRAFAAFVVGELSNNEWVRKQPLVTAP